MSVNPFTADPAIRDRIAAAEGHLGPALRAKAEGMRDGRVINAANALALVDEFGLTDIHDLMLLLLDSARALALPPISQFFVGAVGLEKNTGALILGNNVEFPGTHLGFTVHGEGFVLTHAFHRGTSIAAIALGEAHPCAHCRQYLSEFAATPDMLLIDTLGHRLRMADLYPWPFDPGYLGQTGAVPGATNWPTLNFETATGAPALLALGRRAYAPYSRCPGALLLELADGTTIGGAGVESVAFNPTLQPVQAAMIELLAAGHIPAAIRRAHLGTVAGGAVDYTAATTELLSRIAPQASLTLHPWHIA